jgi:hypothetical protein
MKKFLCLLAALLLLGGCGKELETSEQQLRAMEREEGLEKGSLQELERIELIDQVLVWAADQGRQAENNRYYVGQFSKAEDHYTLEHMPKLMEWGENLYSLHWQQGMVFFSDNPKSKSLRLIFGQGYIHDGKELVESRISIEEVPFLYYLNQEELRSPGTQETSMEFYFLDEEGNAISR